MPYLASVSSETSALCSRSSASRATLASAGLSPTIGSAAMGAIAATTVEVAFSSYTTTLHGRSSPTSSSAWSARSARGGLHAPQITYLRV
jgi:hypothetical protein